MQEKLELEVRPDSQDADLRASLESQTDGSGRNGPGVPFKRLGDILSTDKIKYRNPHLPDKFQSLTYNQCEAVIQILDAFQDNKVVVLDAPTGSGKTVIAETVRQLLGQQGLYVCHSKTLQDQFFADFPLSGLVKGRSNYLPQRKFTGVTCADCNKNENTCTWCPDVQNCAYELAKRKALSNPIAVLNSTYFLTECNGPGRFANRGLGILDEADTLESELMRFVEIRITMAMRSKLGLRPPDKITKEEAWIDWVNRSSQIVKNQLIPVDPDETDLKTIRHAKYVWNLHNRLGLLADGLENKDWIYTGSRESPDISFKPVVVDRLGREFLWGHCGKFLVMSASIISPSLMMDDLGYEGSYKSVNMESQFDVKNRLVKVIPVANMSRKVNEREELLAGIIKIANRHPDVKILLHTVSYDLAKFIDNALTTKVNRPVYTYTNAGDRDKIVDRYRQGRNGILVAPSLDRGIDFKDDDCRVVVICKVPFPYLGDKQVSQRLYGKNGQTWYNVQTVRTIVQMTGRGTRHKDDYSTNYILDKQFSGLWQKGKNLFPQWWKDSLDWRDTL